MERPAELELGRLATPEEDCEYDDPEEREEEKKVEQKEEEEEEERKTDETVTKEEKEHAVGEVEEEEEDEEEDVKKGEKVSLLEGRASPPLSSANTSMNTSGEKNPDSIRCLLSFFLKEFMVKARHFINLTSMINLNQV